MDGPLDDSGKVSLPQTLAARVHIRPCQLAAKQPVETISLILALGIASLRGTVPASGCAVFLADSSKPGTGRQ